MFLRPGTFLTAYRASVGSFNGQKRCRIACERSLLASCRGMPRSTSEAPEMARLRTRVFAVRVKNVVTVSGVV